MGLDQLPLSMLWNMAELYSVVVGGDGGAAALQARQHDGSKLTLDS